MFIYAVLEQKCPVSANLVTIVPEFDGNFCFCCFGLEAPFLGKFGPKSNLA